MVTFTLSRNVHRVVTALSVFVLIGLVLVPVAGSAADACLELPPHSDTCTLHACGVSGLPVQRVESASPALSVWTLTERPPTLPAVHPDPTEHPPRA